MNCLECKKPTTKPTARIVAGTLRPPRSRDARRRGAVAVEFAIVAVPMFLLVFTIIEFGRAMMAIQTMEEAARAGCRMAIVRDADESAILAEIRELLSAANIDDYNVIIEPAGLALADRWEPVSVTIAADFDSVTLFPKPYFLKDVTLSSSCTLPKECSPTD